MKYKKARKKEERANPPEISYILNDKMFINKLIKGNGSINSKW